MPCLEENDAKKRARLLDSLNRSFPSSALSKVLHMACDENVDPLSSSCFADIRLERFHPREEVDDELTSLAWLQDANLLKNITPNNKCASPQPKYDSSSLVDLPNAPYDALMHRKHKPPYSFSCLIFMAIEASPSKCLPVKGIYDWIVQSFPYFHTAPTGWRNSVRHNLSLNKCFKKVDRDYRLGLGKGSSWCIDSSHRPNLLQALRRTPYHPFQQLQMISSVPGATQLADECTIGEEEQSDDEPISLVLDLKMKHVQEIDKPYDLSQPVSKRQSAFADVGKIHEKIMHDMRRCSDSDDLVCTAYPNEDHIYSIPVMVVEEARLKETCHVSKVTVNQDSQTSNPTDSDENEEQRTLYFTSLALLELAAGKQPISNGNRMHEIKYDSIEKDQRSGLTRPRKSRRSRNESVALRKSTRKNRGEPLVAACKPGKRKRKQLLPINSSLWGKRRKLPEEDVNLNVSLEEASKKKILSTARTQKIVRRRRK